MGKASDLVCVILTLETARADRWTVSESLGMPRFGQAMLRGGPKADG